MAGANVVDHPEFRLPCARRHEFAYFADLPLGVDVYAGPPMKAIQRNPAENQQCQGQGKRQRFGRGCASDGPSVVDALVRCEVAWRKADSDRNHFTLAARSVTEGRDLGPLRASRSEAARNG